MAAVTIRAARPGDVAAVAAIYNAGIAGRQATFETRPRAPEEILEWLERGLPFLVAENGDGRVLGFARVSPYSSRPLYAGVGDHGVYVDAAARGQGLGRRLLDELAVEAERHGMYKLTSRIFTTNAAAAPSTARPASRRSASRASTAGSTASGSTASSSTACWATPPPRAMNPRPPPGLHKG